LYCVSFLSVSVSMFTVYCLMDPCGLISNKDDDADDNVERVLCRITCWCAVYFTGTSGDLFESMQLVKVGGDLDANKNIVNYFHGIIAGMSVSYFRLL